MNFKKVVINGKEDKVEYPLSSTWKIYDHEKSDNNNYDKSTRCICSFSDVITFWQFFNNIPLPSNLFYQSNTGKPYYKLNDNNDKKREIASISIFRNNIEPKWEDPINKKGGEINLKKFYKKHMSSVEYLDKLWETLILACIGENFQYSEEITGIRVVDSSLPNRPLYRIELWFSNLEHSGEMEKNFRKILELNDDDAISHKIHEI